MTTYRAYGTPELGKSAMFRVTEPRHATRTVLSHARGLHYPQPYEAADGWRCRDCLQRLRTYPYRGGRNFRHHPNLVDNSVRRG